MMWRWRQAAETVAFILSVVHEYIIIHDMVKLQRKRGGAHA